MNRVTADGTACTLSGPEDAPVVALVHGLGLHRGTFRDYVPTLAHSYRVVAYDLYGHGESAAPPERPGLSLYARQLAGLLDAVGIERCCVAGFSLGGMINRRFAIDHRGRVSSLIVLNSPHERGPELQRRVEAQAADAAAGGPGATIDAAIARWFTPDFIERHPEAIAEVRSWVLANDPAVYADARRVLAHGVLELIRPDPPIASPALVMTCEHDAGSTPAMARAIASEIAGAECIVLPGLRHMGLMERPDLFLEPMLDFLGRIDLGNA